MKDDEYAGGGGGGGDVSDTAPAGGVMSPEANPIDQLVDSYQKKTGGSTGGGLAPPSAPAGGTAPGSPTPKLSEAAPGLGAVPSALAKIPGQVAEGLGLPQAWDSAKKTVVDAGKALLSSAGGQIGKQITSPTYGTPPSDLFAREERRAAVPGGLGLPGGSISSAAPPVVPTTGNAPVSTANATPPMDRPGDEGLGLPGATTPGATAPAAPAEPATAAPPTTEVPPAENKPPVVPEGWDVLPGKGYGGELMISKKEMITLPDGSKIPKLSIKPLEGTFNKDVAARQDQEAESKQLAELMDLAVKGERLNQSQKEKAFEWADTIMSNVFKENLTGEQAQNAIHIVNQMANIAAGGHGGSSATSAATGLLNKKQARESREEQAKLTREQRAQEDKNRREDKAAALKQKKEDDEARAAATRITSFTRHISNQKNAFGEKRSPASVLVDMLKMNQPIPKEFGPSVEGMVKTIRAKIAYKELELKRKLNYDERNAIFDSYRDELDKAAR